MRGRLAGIVTASAVLVGAVGGAAPASPHGRNLATGAGAAAAPTVAVVSSLATVRPMQSPTGRASASISAAQNEYESFQVVVSAGTDALSDVRVSLASPLSGPGGTIPAGNVVLYREGYLDIDTASDLEGGTGRWPDALIPAVDTIYGERRNAFPIDVPADQNRVAWVDVLVPRGQPPGPYAGELLVEADGGFQVSVPVQLAVRDFGLPSTTTLRSAFGLYGICPAHYRPDWCPTEREAWALQSLYVRMALENRVTVNDAAYRSPVANARNPFRRYVLPLLQGRSPQDVAGLWHPMQLTGARLTSIGVDVDYLDDWRQEAGRGHFARRAFLYACDEPNRDQQIWQLCKRRANLADERWPVLDVLVTATARDARDFSAARLIDLLVPIVNAMHDKPGSGPDAGNQRPTYASFAARPGNELWLYNACPSHSCTGDPGISPYWAGWPSYVVDQPSFEHRAMGVAAYRYRATGELYFAMTADLSTAWEDQYSFGGNGDGTLFYPGTTERIGGQHDIPIESIRLKRIRDGHEDFEYFVTLDRRGNAQAAHRIARDLLPTMYQADRSPSVVERTRDRLATLIENSRD